MINRGFMRVFKIIVIGWIISGYLVACNSNKGDFPAVATKNGNNPLSDSKINNIGFANWIIFKNTEKIVFFRALKKNDFSSLLINKGEAYEVNYLRKKALSLVNEKDTKKEKALKIMDWLNKNYKYEETNLVNAMKVLSLMKGMCEINGAYVGLMESLGIKGRYVAIHDTPKNIYTGTELFIDNNWLLFNVRQNKCFDKSMLELNSEHKDRVSICLYWRNGATGALRRSKLWYSKNVAGIFETDKGLEDLTWKNFKLSDYIITNMTTIPSVKEYGKSIEQRIQKNLVVNQGIL